MKILVSACLLGHNCKYNGGNNYSAAIESFCKGHEVIPVCPEQLGGLPTPRTPSERLEDKVITADGQDVTRAFFNGAQAALKIAMENHAELAILQSRSPSCGSGRIYDGSFSGAQRDGWGVTAELLREDGILIFGESRVKELL